MAITEENLASFDRDMSYLRDRLIAGNTTAFRVVYLDDDEGPTEFGWTEWDADVPGGMAASLMGSLMTCALNTREDAMVRERKRRFREAVLDAMATPVPVDEAR